MKNLYSILLLKGVYLTIWIINICPLTYLYKAFLNIIGGKGAMSNIKYQIWNIIIIITMWSKRNENQGNTILDKC